MRQENNLLDKFSFQFSKCFLLVFYEECNSVPANFSFKGCKTAAQELFLLEHLCLLQCTLIIVINESKLLVDKFQETHCKAVLPTYHCKNNIG